MIENQKRGIVGYDMSEGRKAVVALDATTTVTLTLPFMNQSFAGFGKGRMTVVVNSNDRSVVMELATTDNADTSASLDWDAMIPFYIPCPDGECADWLPYQERSEALGYE
jgi:hypothetical protein